MVRTTECPPEVQEGRLKKANGFLQAAEMIEPYNAEDVHLADAYVTLCVHAGIAASDVICCSARQVHPKDPDHRKAVTFLEEFDGVNSIHLSTLIEVKSTSAYTAEHATLETCAQMGAAATELVRAANALPRRTP